MKKKRKWIVAVSVILVLFVGLYLYLFVGAKNPNRPEIIKGAEDTDALVVYFTRSGVIDTDGADAVSSASLNRTDGGLMGNTQLTANAIRELTGADMFEIQTDRYYRKSFMGTAATAWLEEKLDLRPKLAGMPENLDKYRVIYVGFPIWWFNAPMAVGTFLESYDFKGKTVIPFCTSQDNDISISIDFIRDCCGTNADLEDGFRVFDNQTDKNTIQEWLNGHGLIQDKEIK